MKIIFLILVIIVVVLTVRAIYRKITKTYYDTYRVIEKPREEDPDRKYYVLEQLTNQGWEGFDWQGKTEFRYKGYKSEKLSGVFRNYYSHSGRDQYKMIIHFDSAEDANKALKIMIEFKRKVDNMPEAKVIKEVTYE